MKTNTKPTRFKALLAVAGLTLLTAISSQATDRFWTAGTATFNSAGNWSPSAVPNGGDNAINNNGGTVVITMATRRGLPSTFAVAMAAGTPVTMFKMGERLL